MPTFRKSATRRLSIAVVVTSGTILMAGMTTLSANAATHHGAITSKPRVCYSQQADGTGIAIAATHFGDPHMQSYDSDAADDLALGRKCKVSEVDLNGIFTGGDTPPAPMFEITFAKSSKTGGPGKIIATQTVKCVPTDQGVRCPVDPPVVLNGLCTTCPPMVMESHLYLDPTQPKGAQTADDVTWRWETTSDLSGAPGIWQNPNDGYGTGCTSWAPMLKCIAGGEGPDFMFTLIGK